MGGRQFEGRFSALLQQLTARYRGNTAQRFAVSVSPPPGARPQPSPPPRQQRSRGARSSSFPFERSEPSWHEVRYPTSSATPANVQAATDFEDSLSLRTVDPILRRENLDSNRRVMRSTDQDIINDVCRTEEELRILRRLPQYIFLGKEQKLFVRSIGAIIRMGVKRKRNFQAFIQEMKRKSTETLPTFWLINLFLATVNNPDPFTHVTSLEIAVYLDRQIPLSMDELNLVMTARCVPCPLENEERTNTIHIDGWSFRLNPTRKEG
eukprot:Tbor_TRINITY_DN6155_c3_g4::TRINITY_DN6155_c3_g4_i8::g.22677::m.22677